MLKFGTAAGTCNGATAPEMNEGGVTTSVYESAAAAVIGKSRARLGPCQNDFVLNGTEY